MLLLPVARGPYTTRDEGLGFVGWGALVDVKCELSRLHTESKALNCLNSVSLHGHCSVKVRSISSGSKDNPIVAVTCNG